MSIVEWSMKGPEYVSCNCDWGCPCQFNALPTDGTCRGMAVMRIDEGRFGGLSLDGLCWILTMDWPGAVHEGNGAQQAIIDERADAAQREALSRILYGEESEPGSTMLQIFATTMTTVHDPLFAPIAFEVDLEGRTASVSVPGLVESKGEPIRNPVTGAEHRARVTLPNGFEYTEAEYGSGTTKATGAVPLEFADSYGQFAMLHLTHSGVVR